MSMTEIHNNKIILIGRVTSPGYQTTERDVAEAAELVNQYLDELDKIMENPQPYHEEVVINIDGKAIRFANVDQFADWLAGALC